MTKTKAMIIKKQNTEKQIKQSCIFDIDLS